MKKILLAIALLLPALTFADGVSQEQARKIAETFLSARATRSLAPTALTLKWTGSSVQTVSLQQPAFYVFDNAAGGFVIVAGEDSVDPILGYSPEGEFVVEGMPDNVKYWFDYLQDGIAYMRTKNAAPSAAIKAQWSAYRSGIAPVAATRAGTGKELNTALWNQGEPFNIKASEFCSQQWNTTVKVYTGCVATATAIIMRHHQYPKTQVTAQLPGYEYDSDTKIHRAIGDYTLNSTYNWANMPTDNGTSSTWTDTQKNAVAQLMLDCGVMVKMQYGVVNTDSGSAAVTAYVPEALVNYMGYDHSYDVLIRVYYPRDEWVSRIISSIDNDCPVLLSGSSASGGGHAFILDGYDSENKIHINWGWGGYQNGYYTAPDFGDYAAQQTAFVDIRPNQNGTAPETFIYQYDLKYTDGPTVDTQAGTITMSISTSTVGNGGASTFYGTLCLAHADKDDNIKTILYSYNNEERGLNSGSGYGYLGNGTYTLNIKDVANGDKIGWYYKFSGRTEYLPARYNLESSTGNTPLQLPDGEDIFDIEEGSSAEYSAAENKLIITTHTALKYTLKSSTGSDIDSGTELNKGVLTIDLASLSAGTYILTLNVGKNSKELKFTVGQ